MSSSARIFPTTSRYVGSFALVALVLGACGEKPTFVRATVRATCFPQVKALSVNVTLTENNAQARTTTVCVRTDEPLKNGSSFSLQFSADTRGQLELVARAVDSCTAVETLATATAGIALSGIEANVDLTFDCTDPPDMTMQPDMAEPTCCGFPLPGPSTVVLNTVKSTGFCGDLTFDDNSKQQLQCGGLYFGGANVALPLPILIPQNVKSVSKVTKCEDDVLTLAKSTLEDTAEGCTEAGCVLGPPLPAPNNTTPGLSTCIITRLAEDLTGTTDCKTGMTDVHLSLISETYLTGDTVPPLDDGIQACPICVDGLCKGGKNDGNQCTTTNDVKTTHECLPNGMPQAKLALDWNLTTGDTTWESMAGTNNSGQNHVFCGYCRDIADMGSLNYPDGGVACSRSTEMVSTCEQPFESCEQRSNGAFKRADAKSLRMFGRPSSENNTSVTLQSIFCIPPANAIISDTFGDLPGPAAVSFQGSVEVLK